MTDLINRPIKVLSLFDGMSCGQIALNRIGITPTAYYASEVDRYAITVTQANYPSTIQMGDVTKWREWNINWSSIDLVTGGFPCQAWSVAGKQQGDKDERGMLFWVMLDIMKHVLRANPRAKFLMENVKMKREFEQYITHHTEAALGKVFKILINSALVSAQNRQRYYWTNWQLTQPEDKGIFLADVLQNPEEIPEEMYHGDKAVAYMERGNDKWMQAGSRRADRYTQTIDTPKPFTLTANMHKGVPYNYFQCPNPAATHWRHPLIMQKGRGNNSGGLRALDGKTPTMTACSWQENNHLVVRNKSKCVRSSGRGSYDRHEWDSISDCHYRKLTPVECERLQTIPDQYTAHVSNTQRYKMIGNAWTVDVIAHILKEGLL
jgi:DNA-cytosine methyltransferase